MIYTVGYNDKDFRQLSALMDKYKIDLLVDVRTKPQSHKSQFNRACLEWRLKERYLWEGDRLGGLTKVRSPFYDEGLASLVKMNKSGKNLLLMCMETNPDKCHRKMWISRDLEKQFGVKVEHL